MINNKLNIQIPIVASACPIEVSQDLNMLGMVITKSVTLESRLGNPEAFYEYPSKLTWNNMGLPNLGIKDFIKIQLPRYQNILEAHIPLIISLYAKNDVELLKILEELKPVRDIFYGIELNLSCPNIKTEILCDNALIMINELYDKYSDKFISLKLAPSVTDDYLKNLIAYTNVRWINCFNTIPQSQICYGLKGGLGGKPVKDIYIRRIKNIKQKYPELNIIATGGIESGQDIKDYLNAGASVTGVASYFLKHKSNIKSLVTEYVSYYMAEGEE